jgi:hypothetical protein
MAKTKKIVDDSKPLTIELTISNPAANQWPIQQFHDADHLTDWLTNEDCGVCPEATVSADNVTFTENYKDEKGADATREVVFGTLKSINITN